MNVTPTAARPEPIPPPADDAEAAAWRRDMAILDADPRTAGVRCRPTWLVKRVLGEAAAAGRR